MTIRFTCSECTSVLKIKDELAGTTGRCPKCKTKFVVPSTDGQTDSGAINAPKIAAANKPKTSATTLADSQVAPRKSTQLEDSSDDKPLSLTPDSESGELPLTLPDSAASSVLEDTIPLSTPPESNVESDDELPLSGDSAEDLSMDAPYKGRLQPSSFDDDDDLDSPPVLAGSSLIVPPKEASGKPKAHKPQPLPEPESSEISFRDYERPRKGSQKSSDSAFDPMKYLGSDSHAPDNSSLNMMDDSDLSLSEDSDYDLLGGSPTPQPLNRPSPKPISAKPIAAKPAPDKVDLASAAKMMKKAIKDAQSDATKQRQLDANPGFDYGLFFREFGLRGLGIVVGLVVAFFVTIKVSNYVMTTPLRTPKLGIVRGKITMDGTPLADAQINFAPIETAIEGSKRERARTSIGISDKDGHFKMMYSPLDKIEGVAAGKCRVYVTHMGPKGDDVPSSWREGAMKIVEIPAGAQKSEFKIEMAAENRR